MSQQYSLRWNNHQPNFISQFTTALNTQTLVDVTLAAEGKHLQAHKIVLSACSTYFQALFIDNPSRHPIVILKDVTFQDLRTMVDFMYCGEVNVTEEQLPQVLDTAKLLKIKGLTEMPESTSLTRAQSNTLDFQSPGDSADSQRHSASPAGSPSTRRRRRRKSSTCSAQMSMEEGGPGAHSVDLVRDSITLSSVPPRRRHDFAEEVMQDNTMAQQHQEAPQMNVEPMPMDNSSLPQDDLSVLVRIHAPAQQTTSPATSPPPGPANAPASETATETAKAKAPASTPETAPVTTSPTRLRRDLLSSVGSSGSGTLSEYSPMSPMASLLQSRRGRPLRRQRHVADERAPPRKQASEPAPASASAPASAPAPASRVLQKHSSYPPCSTALPPERKRPRLVQEAGRSVPPAAAHAHAHAQAPAEGGPARARHTPAVRFGPRLSCAYCWNTVDDCSRILRRKTQFHCPECRTNLCIVPCFQLFHEGLSRDPAR